MSHRPGAATQFHQPRRYSCLRIFGAILLGLLVLGAAAYVLRRPLLTGFANALTVDDPLVRADFIYLLGGDAHIRPVHAAQLYRNGFAPRVVITAGERPGSAPPDTANSVVQLLRLEGVPDSAIMILPLPPGAASTQDEGRALRRHLEQRPAEHVIVVTSPYHTRRARWTLRRELKGVDVDLRMSAAPDPRFNASNWWQNEEGFVAYLTEALKFVHTLLR